MVKPWYHFSHKNWVPKPKGKHKIEYEEDATRRANKKSQRKRGLITSAHDLSVISNAEIFIKCVGPPHKLTGKKDIWVYSSSDEMYNRYKNEGIKPSTDVKEGRLDQDCDLIDTIKIFKSKPTTGTVSAGPSSTVTTSTSSDNMQINLNPGDFFVTPTKTVAADLNFANVSENILGISTIDLPSVSQIVDIETSDSLLDVGIIAQAGQSDAELALRDGSQLVFSTPISASAVPVSQQEIPAHIANNQILSTPTSTPTFSVSEQASNMVGNNVSVPPSTASMAIIMSTPTSASALPSSQQALNVVESNVPASSSTAPKAMIKSLVAKRMKFKQEQVEEGKKVTDPVQCVVCHIKKKKKDAKWQWKVCSKCPKEAHTICLGLTKQDKSKTFVCEACDNENQDTVD